jgi:hypothetical protein
MKNKTETIATKLMLVLICDIVKNLKIDKQVC